MYDYGVDHCTAVVHKLPGIYASIPLVVHHVAVLKLHSVPGLIALYYALYTQAVNQAAVVVDKTAAVDQAVVGRAGQSSIVACSTADQFVGTAVVHIEIESTAVAVAQAAGTGTAAAVAQAVGTAAAVAQVAGTAAAVAQAGSTAAVGNLAAAVQTVYTAAVV